MALLSNLSLTDSKLQQEQVIVKLIQCVCDLNEVENNGEKSQAQIAILEHKGIEILLQHLQNNATSENESLLAGSAQLIAELAKTEALREPLVSKGVVPNLLKHLPSKNIALATQVCRALGNICYDNDQGRIAVDKNGGIPIILDVLSKQINSTEDGASRLRVIVCGFLLNLTNNCEQLQDRAIDNNVLETLNECISSHLQDEDLTNMALLTIGSIIDSDSGKSAAIKSGLMDTFKQLLDQKGGDNLKEIIVDLMSGILEHEVAKEKAADNGLCQSLVNIVNSDSYSPELGKMASELLVTILVGDKSMEKLYMSGEGPLLQQSVEWLSSENDSLKTLGTLAIGNFARREIYCQQLVEKGIVEKLMNILRTNVSSESSFLLHHAVFSTLRNLAIPVSNKPKLLSAGVLEICLTLINTDVMAVVFKLLGVLRMLIEGQEAAAVKLGQERAFLDRLSDWCGVEAHAGVKGEATRVMASLVKNSRSSAVILNLIRAEGISHLVSMAMSEHLVMQNEAIMALTIICSTALGEAAIPLKEADLTETVIMLLKDEKLPAEMMCNVFSLLQAIITSGNLQEEILTSGVLELVRSLEENHVDDKVKVAARSTANILEQSMSCS